VTGCWITHTNSGTTQLDLVGSADGTVTGMLSWSGNTYAVSDGHYDGSHLTMTIDWGSFICTYDFTSVSTTQLSGTALCATNTQAITADRTCP